MKKITIFYWIVTGLLLAMMLFSAISTFLPNPEGTKMMAAMGYKPYVLQLLAVGKILAIIAILVPGFPRIKEWAYAGLTFDLVGATFSMYVSGFPVSAWAPMFIFIALLVCSYILYHKRLELKTGTAQIAAA
jgi:hypothetical protein